MSNNDRYQSIIATFGKEQFERIQASRVLVVGAGGIGCEILKNLALSGFKNVELIDLDTIDVSNLNRQFLFRDKHVTHSKAVVAAAAAMAFNPDVKITAHHGNVKDPQFGISYIQTFQIVLNALDNIDARRHVNRLCLAANVPLIDSGTTGYLGQVMPIFKGKTACYECTPKPTQKVYPICTIRSTPDKPVHCIVWAKECFKLLFGNAADSMLYEDPASGEESTYMHLTSLPKNGTSSSSSTTSSLSAKVVMHGAQLLLALYRTEVLKRIDMGIYKTAKSAPIPLEEAIITSAQNRALDIINSIQDKGTEKSLVLPSQGVDWDRNVWSDEDCAVEMLLCMVEAVSPSTTTTTIHSSASNGDTATATTSSSLLGKMAFDKDDLLAMRFVCAAANMRCRIFGIPAQSFHDAKGIAGNIIPAIATTNAIVAGIQVLQAVKIVGAGDEWPNFIGKCPHAYCLRNPTQRGVYLQPSRPEEPMSSCYVCNTAQLSLQIDTEKATLSDLLKFVVKGKLGFNQPSVRVGHHGLYEEGEDADEDLVANLPKMLCDCPAGGLKDGTIVSIEDYTQDLTVQVVIRHVDIEALTALKTAQAGKEEATVDTPGELFILGGKVDMSKKTSSAGAEAGEGDGTDGAMDTAANVDGDDDDDIVIFDPNEDETMEVVTAVGASSKKRGREELDNEEDDGGKKKK